MAVAYRVELHEEPGDFLNGSVSLGRSHQYFEDEFQYLVVKVVLAQFVVSAEQSLAVSEVELELPLGQQSAAQHVEILFALDVFSDRALLQLIAQLCAEMQDENIEKTVFLKRSLR